MGLVAESPASFYVTRRATAAEYLAMDEHGPKTELLAGELFTMAPSPNFPHQRIAVKVAAALGDFFDKNGGGCAVADYDFRLFSDTIVRPDVAVVLGERAKLIYEHPFPGAPDLVVEVLSQDRDYDLVRKRQLYVAAGVREMWAVDTEAATVTLFRAPDLMGAAVAQIKAPKTLTSPLLPGFRLRLSAAFSRPPHLR